MTKPLSIIGLGYGGYSAPIGTAPRWTLNTGFIYPEIDRLFWMHDDEEIIRSCGNLDVKQYFNRLDENVNGFDIVGLTDSWVSFSDTGRMHIGDATPKYKSIKGYPIEAISKMYGGLMVGCTLIYMILLAIKEGYNTINLYGFEVFSNPQKASYPTQAKELQMVERFAFGKNARINVPLSTMFQAELKNTMYGYVK